MKWINGLIVLACFTVYLGLFEQFGPIKYKLDSITGIGLLNYIATYFLVGLPLFAGTFALEKRQLIFCTLGICENPLRALGFAVLFALPMFIGGLLLFQTQTINDYQSLAGGTIVAGFFEELYFRGFLFGLLYRKTRLGFIPCVVIAASVFGFGHLWQGHGWLDSLGVFGITFLGSILFSWLYAEWQYNLWIPVFLHTLMNLAWALFDMDDHALGGFGANLLRALTIATAIIFTLVYKRKRDEDLELRRPNLWLKPNL